LESDLLNTNKNAMFALGQFAQDVLGTSTVFTGLACVPNTPAAMNVIVQPGAVYAQAALDATAYSSLAADSTVTQKQGILKTAQTFATPAPVTSGQSIVYLISGAFLEADTNAVVLPYYNASNPSQAFSGPNGTGASQNTLRQDTVQLTLTAGVPATTGSQLTPATPVGQIALYTITVAFGASTVVAGNIAKVAGAPFLTASMLAQIQANATAIAAVPTAGRLIRTLVYTNVSGTQNVSIDGGTPTTTGASTYVPSSSASFVIAKVLGGGGGGGGAATTSTGQAATGSGGASGSLGVSKITAAIIGASQAVTVGAAGAFGGVGGNGGNGGASSLGSLITASGGGGGPVGLASAPPYLQVGGVPSGAPTFGGSVTAIVSTGGNAGILGACTSLANGALSGAGGHSPLTGGGGGAAVLANTIGKPAASVGAGGGGGAVNATQAGTTGGIGGAGCVIIEEYA
jgi:hypothetical protein